MDQIVIDCETGVETVVPFTDDEVARQQADALAAAERDAAESTTAAAAATKRARLAVLREQGWANLTTAEKTEAQSLMLELA